MKKNKSFQLFKQEAINHDASILTYPYISSYMHLMKRIVLFAKFNKERRIVLETHSLVEIHVGLTTLGMDLIEYEMRLT